MNSSSIKNLLLILLFAVNVFLIIHLAFAGSSGASVSYEEAENAVRALEKKEVYVEIEQIPLKQNTQSIISISCSVQDRISAAEKLMGKILAEYNLPNGITYQSDNSYITFFDSGKFEYGLIEDRDTEAADQNGQIHISSVTGDTRKKVKKAFSKLVSHSENKKMFSLSEIGQSENNDTVTVYADLMIDGLKADNGLIIFKFRGNKLIYVSGKYVFDTFDKFYTKEYIDATSALFLIEKRANVEKMQMTYYPVMTDTDSYFFVPSWHITTSSGETFTFDAVSGYERK